mgnify:CR=1 FL=1
MEYINKFRIILIASFTGNNWKYFIFHASKSKWLKNSFNTFANKNFNTGSYKRWSIIVINRGWSIMVAVAQAEVNNPRKK